jgi:phage repressor protein C with HTH and peptisase S24 domain
MKNISDWVKAELKRTGKTQRELAKAIGMASDVLNKILSAAPGKKRRKISAEELLAIERYFKSLEGNTVPLEDISRNANPKGVVATQNNPGVEFLRGPRPTLVRDLPIRGHTKAGETGFFFDQGEARGFAMRPESLRGVDEAYAVRVHDDCMVPRYKAGTVLQVDPFRHAAPGDNIVIQLLDGQCFVKELVRRAGGIIECRQFNPDSKVTWRQSEVRSIHLVVGVDYLER